MGRWEMGDVHADVRSSTTSLQPVFRARLVPPPHFVSQDLRNAEQDVMKNGAVRKGES